MFSLPLPGERERPPRDGYRFPALVWALLHVPLILALYASSIAEAVDATPERYRLPLWPTFVPQALSLVTIAWLVGLPVSLSRRAYRFVAPALVATLVAVLALDSRVYQQVHFHLNGFFLRVAVQPDALKVTGVPLSHVALFLAAAVAFVVVDVALGARFIARRASPRRTWALAAVLLVLGAAERVYGSALTYLAGPSVFAASTVVPQVPVRMRTIFRKVFGNRAVDQFAGQESMRLPVGVPASEFAFTRKPDVLLVISESLPADHFTPETMPRLWRRAEEGGARFTRAYSGACSTSYSLFSLLYGLQPQKLERVVGAGGRAPLFGALRENGYQLRLLAASCLDWMELRSTVFGDVADEHVSNRCDDFEWEKRDEKLFADARALVESADPDKPLFAFVFLFSTHFNYFYPPSSAVHEPAWDGVAGLKTTSTPGWMIKNRAKNAAHGVDARVDEFLGWFEAKRGRKPLVVFTGDHGEEFRQKGNIGHGSAVTSEQIHVPLVVFGEGVPHGTFENVVSHVDVVPTVFSLLGDQHAPAQYSDGVSLFSAPDDRFVLSTVGWEPRYALMGNDLKVVVYAGMAGMAVTDLEDKPLPDGDARVAAHAGQILRALRGEAPRTGTATAASSSAAAPQ